MTPAEQLRAAKALIGTPDRWTKGAYARGRSARRVDALGKSAICFCVVGALARAADCDPDGINVRWSPGNVAFSFLSNAQDKFCRIYEFNDNPETTHDDALRLYDRAIYLAERFVA